MGDNLPLYGLTFAVKDNIDVAGYPTTAACEAYSYMAGRSAPVVERLLGAGALYIGKTNLDQFASGLAGDRSPYGACRNAFSRTHISGGSSSGSAVAVAAGLVSFALATDTAGSARVPAGCNNIVGLKPAVGLLSTEGVIPCCPFTRLPVDYGAHNRRGRFPCYADRARHIGCRDRVGHGGVARMLCHAPR